MYCRGLGICTIRTVVAVGWSFVRHLGGGEGEKS